MKRLFAILMAVCMMASVLGITAFAAEPAAGIVLRVSAQKKDGTIDIIGDYTSFSHGLAGQV